MEHSGEEPSGDRRLARIAIVDDNEDIVGLLGEVLQRAHYEPELFTRSSDALLSATSMEYDVVITDLEMPDVTGIDLLSRVKDVFPLTQFLMITGYASVKSAADAMHKGAVAYLTKPLTSTQILAHVDKALEKRLLSLENQRLIYELSTTNETLANKVSELERVNDLLKRTQEDLVKVERRAAIGEVVVSINHSINNSISGIKAAARFIRNSSRLGEEGVNALTRIDDECDEIEAVVARLKSLRNADSADYVDGIRMIGLTEEPVDAKA